MSLAEFLAYILTPVGCGIVAAAIMGLLVKLSQDQLPAAARFYGAFALSVLLPFAALWLEVQLGYATWTWEAIFVAGGVAYFASQLIHWEAAGKASAAAAARALGGRPRP